uniref:Neurexin-4 n=1 Tax=Strongyloides venezuelensis TaxID=75913 RepID=A0A0K0F2N7_STRVS
MKSLYILLLQSFFILFLHILTIKSSSLECTDKQYSELNKIFENVQVLQKVAIIAPLGTYYLYTSLTENEDDLTPLLQQNGQKIVIHSSLTANNIEWHSMNVLVKRIKIVPIFEGNMVIKYHTPQLLINSCNYDTKIIYVDDQSYTVDSYNAGLVSMYENELIVNFKTFENGIFFFSVADQGDMLIAQIVNGHIEVTFDFGSLSKTTISGGIALNDGQWHELKWNHQFDSVKLLIDGILLNETTPAGLYRKLDFNYEIEIAGRPTDQYSDDIQSAFHGCLGRVYLNNIDLLSYAPKDKYTNCYMPKPQILTILNEGSSIFVPYSFMPFNFEFRIIKQNSNLLQILNANKDTLLSLSIEKNNSLFLRAEKQGIRQEYFSTTSISDGSWHSLSLKMRGGRFNVELNGLIVLWLEGSFVRNLGLSMTAFNISSVGCFRSASVDLKNALIFGDVIKNKCTFISRCHPNPCENSGECEQSQLDTFKCSCSNGYSGRYCHTSMLPYSCEDYIQRIQLQNKKSKGIFSGFKSRIKYETNITIDIDGSGPLVPFQVQCIYSNKTHPEMSDSIDTILYHDMPYGMYVTGSTEPGSVRRTLGYGITEDTLEKFIDSFGFCKQYMRYQCRGGSKLMTYGNERRPSSWYATRNGQQGLQWANAPPYSRVCECTVNGTCNYNRMCNCDTGRDGVDDGYNTHSQLLPIIQLFIGGTHRTSSVNVTIGPLICTQKNTFDVVTFNDRNQRMVGIQQFNGHIFDLYIQVRFSHPLMTIFTWESKNSERWFQLFVREGYLVAQIVNGGRSQEIQSGLKINDNKWHTVYWEADTLSMKLVVDKEESVATMYNILPWTYNYIIGSRTERGFSGYAGQLRNFYLCGKEINLGLLARKHHNTKGIKAGYEGYCKAHYCKNGGTCIEMYDNYKCNCTLSPFDGDKCDQERSIFVPLKSELSIPWQHPTQMSNCFRMAVQTSSVNVSLIKAKALFAESVFNLSITEEGYLNISMYDGVFFHHQIIDNAVNMSDQTINDIMFCATKKTFELKVGNRISTQLNGNFSFFTNLNVWQFIESNFSGCILRLQVGNSFPLKDPKSSRLTYSPNVKFDVCPHEKLLYKKEEIIDSSKKSDISVSIVTDNHRKLLILTPIIGITIGLVLCILLCCIICYVRSQPDGVYKTNETISAYCTGSPSKSAEYLMPGNVQHQFQPQNKEYFC